MSEIIDNRTQRIRNLKQIITHLHAGGSPEEVRAHLREIVRETDHSELIAMEQELIAGGMPVEEIQSMCDLHSQVTREVLVQFPPRALPHGHPADTFRRENEALRKVTRELRGALAGLPESSEQARTLLNELMDIDKHYQRKEHTVFPRLERHGITGPSKVMWAKDDEVRRLLKEFGAALAGTDPSAAAAAGERALAAVEEMMYKEENILLPMCLDKFTEEDWAVIWQSSPQYGWCLVEPGTGYRPRAAAGETLAPNGSIQFPAGNLTLEQLTAIFSALPVDVTFVDAEDRVRFFSEGPHRVFARSKAVIGRKVQHCHPPRSVAVVERILSDFREGRQSAAEFWLDFQGRFVHIRYLALRNREGRYLGTLEVTQDLTRLCALEGERRLLEY